MTPSIAKYLHLAKIAALMFLSISSGVTKIMLMPQDRIFFIRAGFSDPLIIGFGLVQVLGGILLALPKFRKIGAITIGVTFAVSAYLLFQAGNTRLALITVAFILLLGTFIFTKPHQKA
jgi:uncharacterized membrane protein YphA (DoxX/SURF4 family)